MPTWKGLRPVTNTANAFFARSVSSQTRANGLNISTGMLSGEKHKTTLASHPRLARVSDSTASYLRAQRHAWKSLHTQRPVERWLHSSRGGNKRSTLAQGGGKGNTGSKRHIRNLMLNDSFCLGERWAIRHSLASTHSMCYLSEVKRSGRGRRPGVRRWRGCRRRGRCIVWLLLLLLLLLR